MNDLYTLHDLVSHVMDVADYSDNEVDLRRALRSAQWGFEQAATRHQWNHYDSDASFTLQEQVTGEADVSSDGIVTRTGEIWPDWSELGTYVVDRAPYRVVERIDDENLRLEDWNGREILNESFNLAHNRVVIPDDVRVIFQVWVPVEHYQIDLVSAQEFHEYEMSRADAISDMQIATPRRIIKDNQVYYELRFVPYTMTERVVQVAYVRNPRPSKVLCRKQCQSVNPSTKQVILRRPLPINIDPIDKIIRLGANTEPAADNDFTVCSRDYALSESTITDISDDRKTLTLKDEPAAISNPFCVITDTLDLPHVAYQAAKLYAEAQARRIAKSDLNAYKMLMDEADEELRYAKEKDVRIDPRNRPYFSRRGFVRDYDGHYVTPNSG